jgi:hypothetical protein
MIALYPYHTQIAVKISISRPPSSVTWATRLGIYFASQPSVSPTAAALALLLMVVRHN